jgi:hypothetical protein
MKKILIIACLIFYSNIFSQDYDLVENIQYQYDQNDEYFNERSKLEEETLTWMEYCNI